MSLLFIAIFSVLCSLIGYFLAKKLVKNTHSNSSHHSLLESSENVLRNSEVQRKMILEEAKLAAEEQYVTEKENLFIEEKIAISFNEQMEKELNEKQSLLDKRTNELLKLEQSLTTQDETLNLLKQEIDSKIEAQSQLFNNYKKGIESKSNISADNLSEVLKEEFIVSEKLGCSRWLMEHTESLKADAQKFAFNILESVHHRYQPTFVWPKTSFTLTAPKQEILDAHFLAEQSPLLQFLAREAEVNVELVAQSPEMPPLLKISGGSGVNKEVARLTIEEMINRNVYNEQKYIPLFLKNRRNIDKLVLKMGEEAITALGLPPDVHPEILKLIGSLNYRTSHRQNQYFHSLEVARLAGMIAAELGVDPILAKRAGLLHDIGKVLDYKIEGSHAVISGDYASKYGEDSVVVDTVLAHHDDKIVETAHAYILKAADALSGARPGARVDMVEGYHRRIDGISHVIHSFEDRGVTGSAIMHAGREVHVYVDNRKLKQADLEGLASDIVNKLESEVEYPGQIRITIVRRLEVTEVA